ncbi:hypothetical protein [Flagellimonas sp. 2504JD1-5]
MKRQSLLIAFLILSVCLNAQESFVFKYEFVPNKKYTTQMETNMSGLMDMQADEATLQKMAENGMELPIRMKQKTSANLTSITGARNSAGEIPVTLSYDKMEMEMSMNDEPVPIPNVFENTKIFGKYSSGNKLQVDSISGNNALPNIKEILATAIEQVQLQILFPEHPIKIGDTFDNEIPMNVPIANMVPLEMNVKTRYNLKNIENGIAYFDIDQSLSLDSNQENMIIRAEGSGSGKLEHDIKNNYMSRYETKLPMKMNMLMGETMQMDMQMDTHTVLTISVE